MSARVIGLAVLLVAGGFFAVAEDAAYVCHRIRQQMVVDGRLAEAAWREAPAVPLTGDAAAYGRFLGATARLLWDGDGLYVGIELCDPDLRANWALTEGQVPKGVKEAIWGQEAGAELLERVAERYERHAGLVLAPSPEHELEWLWTPLGFASHQWRERPAGADGRAAWAERQDWSCFGLRQAVFLDGTLNNATDVDRGWSLEVFVPWSALTPFAVGNRLPRDGDEWGMTLRRGHREDFGADLIAFRWPGPAAPAGRLVFQDRLQRFERFYSWGLPSDEDGIRQAAELGFTDATVNWKNAAQMALAKKYGIRTYAVLTPSGGEWPSPETSENPRPWQKMSEAEQACWQELWGRQAARNDILGKARNEGARGVDPTHWGGEPVVGLRGVEPARDVLGTRQLCLGSPELREALQKTIAAMCAVPELDGIAFDFFGYQNFRGCYCERCQAALAAAVQAGEVAAGPAGEAAFYLGQILAINRELVAHVRATRANMLVMSHLYPVFLPQPLYGQQLPFDACGETVAWYIPWDVSKIYRYTKQVSSYPAGIPFLGYYDASRSPAFPYKSGPRLELELQAILDAGGKDIMVCSGLHILSCSEASAAFRKFTVPNRTGQSAETGKRP